MSEATDFLSLVAAKIASPSRVHAVHRTGLLDTEPEDSFDVLTDAAASLLDTDFAFVTIVDERRSFWKSCRGIDLTDLTDLTDRQNPVEESFCQYVIGLDAGFAVPDVRLDLRICDNPSVEAMGVVAWAGEPIRSADGHVLGSFCVMNSSPRLWTSQDREILRALAGAASREVQLWTQVFELQALRAGAEALGELTTRLSPLLTTAEAISLVLTHAPTVLGADFVNVALLDSHATALQVSHPSDVPDAIAARFSTLPTVVATPLTDAVNSGVPVFVMSVEDLAARYPELHSARTALAVEVSAAIPLRMSDGRVIGALGVAWGTAIEMDATRRAALESVAGLCAQTIERTWLTDATKELVTALTVELFPPIPPIVGLDLAARYRPSHDRLAFGGDWYDVVPLSDTRLLLVVGDVVGHGVEAAARMARVRIVLDTLVQQETRIESLLGEAEHLLRHLADPYLATLAIVEIDLDANTIRHLSAGHPPILIHRPGDEVRRSTGAKRPPLGFGGDTPALTVHRFDCGTTLVAFTDGLVERRSASIDDGIDAAALALERAGDASAAAICDELIEASLSAMDTNDDDIAVVVVRRL